MAEIEPAIGCYSRCDINRVVPLQGVELSAVDARDRMAAGQLTSEALTKAYLDRIAKIDDAGPKLDAVIEMQVDDAALVALP